MKWLLVSIGLLSMATTQLHAKAGRDPATALKPGKFSDNAFLIYAGCMANVNKSKSAAFLRMVPQGLEFDKAGSSFLNSNCVVRGVTKMSFKPLLLRQNMYAALYAREYERRAEFVLKADKKRDYSTELNVGNATAPDDFLTWRRYGDCIALAAPNDLHDYLIAMDIEKNEAAFEKLKAPVAQCGSEAKGMQFSRSILRGVLAEALYKFRKVDTRTAHGERLDYVDAIRLEGRDCESCVSALVKGDEVVMGWLPLSSLVRVIKMPRVYSHREAAE